MFTGLFNWFICCKKYYVEKYHLEKYCLLQLNKPVNMSELTKYIEIFNFYFLHKIKYNYELLYNISQIFMT